jgi:hypothetical protein
MRKRKARNWARRFAAAIVENAEACWQDTSGLTEEELSEAQKELSRIAKRIAATDTDQQKGSA